MNNVTTYKGNQSGFIKLFVIVIITIATLWYFKIDIRGTIGIEPAYRYKYVWRAHFDTFWYGIQVWYERQSRSSKPLAWFQTHVNNFVQAREDLPIQTTSASTTSAHEQE